MNSSSSSSNQEVYIGTSLSLKGIVNLTSLMHIDGVIEGEIDTPNVVISLSGHLSGALIADSSDVYGTVEKMKSTTSLVVHSQAVINAQVIYKDVQVVKGGSITEEME